MQKSSTVIIQRDQVFHTTSGAEIPWPNLHNTLINSNGNLTPSTSPSPASRLEEQLRGAFDSAALRVAQYYYKTCAIGAGAKFQTAKHTAFLV